MLPFYNTTRVLLTLALLVGLSDAATGQDKLYWTNADATNDEIVRSDLDGTNIEVLINTGLTNPAGIAVDPINGKIYWTDTQAQTISRAGLDGTDIETLISTDLVTPAGIVLDLIANKMYWIDQGNDTIKRANLDGTGVETLVNSGLLAPIALILNYGPGNTLGANHMYWTDQGDDTIKRANTDGTGVTTLVSGLNNPFEIELDLAAGKMYWTEVAGNVVRRANLDGTGMETIIDAAASALIERPAALAINQGSASPAQGGGLLYVTSRDTPDALLQANLDGTGLTTVTTSNVGFVNFLDVGPAVALPVELVSFDALVESGVVTLTWTTATETDNAGFEVEMTPGARYIAPQLENSSTAWQTLAFVAGAGTSLDAQSYTYRAANLMPGTYAFRLKQVDFDGTFAYGPVVEATLEVPGTHALSGAYPNPFAATATFTLAVARDQHIQIDLFDMHGRKVAGLHNGMLEAGPAHRILLNAEGLPGGLYVYRVTGVSFEESRTILVVRL